MKTIKSVSMTILAAALLTVNGASLTAAEPTGELSLLVNDKKLEQPAIRDQQQQTYLVPLRQVAESLGFEVSWNPQIKAAEVKKGALWSYAKPGEDRYPYQRMYKSLGAAPQLFDDRTWVPVAFVEQILRAPVQISGDTLRIASQAEAERETVQKSGSITRIQKDNGKMRILLNGYQRGILLHVTEETKIVTADGKPGTAADLELGMDIDVVHDSIMALSQPPQTSAREIVIKSKLETADVLGTYGNLEKVEPEDEGAVRITVQGERLTENSFERIQLLVTDKTRIVSTEGNRELTAADLKPEMKVFVYYSPRLTRSAVPQGVAEKIVVEGAETLAEDAPAK